MNIDDIKLDVFKHKLERLHNYEQYIRSDKICDHYKAYIQELVDNLLECIKEDKC